MLSVRPAISAKRPRQSAAIEALESRTLLSESATAQLTLVSTTGSGANPVYHYGISVTDTGTTNIGTFWFAWVPGEDFLPSVPSGTTSPTGWSNTLTGNGNSVDGTAIEWVASSNPITPGNSLSGFGFTTTDSPTALAGNSPSHPATPVLTSFVYSGAPFSDAGFKFQVAPAATTAASTTTLQSSAPAAQAGQSITFTVVVAPSSGTGPVPTGTVNFTRDGTALGQATLQADGTARLSTSALPVGTDNITASYSGDGNYATSASAPVVETISPATTGAATTTVLTSSQPSAAAGAAVTFTATVTPSASGPAPTGTVNFTQNGTLLGTASIGAGGTATFQTSSLAAGSDPIVATYSGDSIYASSASAAFTETITRPATLVPAITASTLPQALVAGSTTKGVVKLKVSNATGASIKGKSTVAVFATQAGTIDSSAILLGQVAKSMNTKAGGFVALAVPIHLGAGTLQAGTYVLVARVTDPSGNVGDSPAAQSVKVAAAFTALSEAAAKSTIPASAASGARLHAVVTLAVTNAGNVSTSGNISVDLFATTSGTIDSGAVQVASVVTRTRIKPGKSARVSIRVTTLPALAAGTYTILARVTDSTGQSSSVPVGTITIS